MECSLHNTPSNIIPIWRHRNGAAVTSHFLFLFPFSFFIFPFYFYFFMSERTSVISMDSNATERPAHWTVNINSLHVSCLMYWQHIRQCVAVLHDGPTHRSSRTVNLYGISWFSCCAEDRLCYYLYHSATRPRHITWLTQKKGIRSHFAVNCILTSSINRATWWTHSMSIFSIFNFATINFFSEK